MTKGLTMNQIRAIFICAGLLVLAGTYFLVYQANMDEVMVLEQESTHYQNQVEFFSDLQLQVNQLRVSTEDHQEKINKFTNLFPSRMTQQKAISNIYYMAQSSGVRIIAVKPGSTQTFLKAGQFQSLTGDTSGIPADAQAQQGITPTADAEKEPEEKFQLHEMVGKSTSYEIELSGTSKQVMRALDWVADNEERMAVDAVTMTFDASSGKLTGTVGILFYELNGNGKIYDDPDISDIIIGTDNVFGTFKN